MRAGNAKTAHILTIKTAVGTQAIIKKLASVVDAAKAAAEEIAAATGIGDMDKAVGGEMGKVVGRTLMRDELCMGLVELLAHMMRNLAIDPLVFHNDTMFTLLNDGLRPLLFTLEQHDLDFKDGVYLQNAVTVLAAGTTNACALNMSDKLHLDLPHDELNVFNSLFGIFKKDNDHDNKTKMVGLWPL